MCPLFRTIEMHAFLLKSSQFCRSLQLSTWKNLLPASPRAGPFWNCDPSEFPWSYAKGRICLCHCRDSSMLPMKVCFPVKCP